MILCVVSVSVVFLKKKLRKRTVSKENEHELEEVIQANPLIKRSEHD